MLVFLQQGLFSGLGRGDWRARSAWTQVMLVPAGSLQRCSGRWGVGAGQRAEGRWRGHPPRNQLLFLTRLLTCASPSASAPRSQCSAVRGCARLKEVCAMLRGLNLLAAGDKVASQGVELQFVCQFALAVEGKRGEGRRGLIRIVSRRAGWLAGWPLLDVVSLAGWMSRQPAQKCSLATWLRSSGRQR